MTNQEFDLRVADLLGLQPEAVRHTVEAVLSTLGERLGARPAEALAEELPGVGRALLRVEHGQEFDLQTLYSRVAERTGTRPGVAVEEVGAVLQVLAETLRYPALYQLRQALPEPVAALLTPGDPREEHAPAHLDPQHHSTLAEGRPGGCHPLYAARSGQAQSQSVDSANPHADTKLSSSRGLTQEREEETLAEGRPGSSRPLSEGRE